MTSMDENLQHPAPAPAPDPASTPILDPAPDLSSASPPPPPLPIPFRPRPRLPRHDTYVTVLLCLINLGIYILMRVFDDSPASSSPGARWLFYGSLNGFGFLSGQWWRPLTYAFLHESLLHLLSNMAFLWFFGRFVERKLGHAALFFLYLAAAMIASPVALLNLNGNPIGSSAAVLGTVAAFWILYFSTVRRMPRKPRLIIFVTAAFILFYLPFPRQGRTVPHLAHLIGAVTGALCVLPVALRPRWFSRPRRWRFQAALTLAAVAVAFAPLLIYPNPYKISTRAQLAFDRGDYAQAITDINLLIRSFPSYSHSYEFRAHCYSALGQYNLAAQDHDEAIKVDPLHPAPYLERAAFYLEVGQPAKALYDFYSAVSRGENQNRLTPFYGHYYLEKGDFPQAISVLTFAIEHAPPSLAPYAYYNRGLAYFATRQFKEAEADWRESARLRKAPRTQAGALEDIGFIYLARGQFHQALDHTDTVKAIYADKPYNLLVRAIAADRLHRPDLAPAPALLKSKLRREYAWELKLLLPPDLWHYYEEAIR